MDVELLESRIAALERLILGTSMVPPAEQPKQVSLFLNAQSSRYYA